MVRSPDTLTRPTRSVSTPNHLPAGEAVTPAVHMTVLAASGFPAITTPFSSIASTGACVRTSTPRRLRAFCAFFANASGKAVSILGAASTRIIRAEVGSILRKSDARALWASSAIAPDISTPVGPAPTKTNVISARCISRSGSISAASNARRILRRIAVASGIDFKPGANGSHASCPK